MNEELHASDRCKRFIKGKESCRLRAYADPKTGGAPWTCGHGTTRGVTADTVWDQDRCDAEFELDILEAEAVVRRYVIRQCTQGQFDAFVSIFQNIGPGRADRPGHEGRDGIGILRNGKPSTLLRKFNDGDISGAESQWPLWCSPGSSVEHGLKERRFEELAMFRGEPE